MIARLKKIYHRAVTGGEKYFRTDIQYILKGGSWIFFGQAAGIGTSLLLAIGYSHFLPKETYGTYKYILSVIGVLALFTLGGMETAAQRGIAQGKEAVFWDTLKFRMKWGVGASLSCALVGGYYYLQGNLLLAAVFFSISPFLIVMDPLAHFNAILVGKKRFRHASVYSVLIQIISAIMLFITVFLSKDLYLLMMVYVLGTIAIRGYFFYRTLEEFPPNNVRDDESFTFGKHLSAVNMLGTATSKLDAILLFHFLGAVPLAIYSFAQAAVSNIQNAFKIVTTTLAFPKMAGQDKETLKKTLESKVLRAHAFTVPLAIIAALAMPYIYRLLFPAYLDSIPYAQAMTLLLAFSPLRFISTAITAKASVRTYYTLAVSNPIVLSLCLIICVPLWGIWGVIAANAIQQSISNILGLYLFRRM